jgi:hypothetical protein
MSRRMMIIDRAASDEPRSTKPPVSFHGFEVPAYQPKAWAAPGAATAAAAGPYSGGPGSRRRARLHREIAFECCRLSAGACIRSSRSRSVIDRYC